MRSRRLWLGLLLVASALAAAGYAAGRAIETRRLRAGLLAAKEEMAAGDYRAVHGD